MYVYKIIKFIIIFVVEFVLLLTFCYSFIGLLFSGWVFLVILILKIIIVIYFIIVFSKLL